MQPPATTRTPDGQKLHPTNQVQKPDAYKPNYDGKIKAPPSFGVQVAGFVGELAPSAIARRRRIIRIVQRIQRRMRWQHHF
jgi:hypothetical protein